MWLRASCSLSSLSSSLNRSLALTLLFLLAQTTNLSTSKFLRRVTPEVFVLMASLPRFEIMRESEKARKGNTFEVLFLRQALRLE
jgi:hypothetical protein